MANPEDLKLLDAGAVDLSGCDLSGADLSKRLLPGRDLSHANLNSANAQSANLSNSKFFGATLVNFNANGADFSGSSFIACAMQRASFARANLRSAILTSTQIHNCDFREADLRGADFEGAYFGSDTKFDGVNVDDSTSFEGARGTREMSRQPAFAAYSYEGGVFRKISAGKMAPGIGVGRSVLPAINSPNAENASEAVTLDLVGPKVVLEEQDAEHTAQRLAADPRLFAELASYAASSIGKELERLGAKIPNEPEALDGYERVRDALQNLQSEFYSLADAANRVQATESTSHKLNLARDAVSAAQGIAAGFIGWLDQNGPQAGKVIAELGLAGVVAGTLAYFTGVSPTLAFSVSVAALSGKSIWDAVAMFASNKKSEKN